MNEALKPVARAHVTLEDDGLSADLEVMDGAKMQVGDSPVDLYLGDEIADLKARLEAAEKDSARWNALMTGGRVRMMGSANVDYENGGAPDDDNWVHFGAEFWSAYPNHDDAELDRCDRNSRKWFQHAVTALADRMLETES